MIQEIDIMYMFRELYIDPGTGGMLFTLLFGLFGVVVFAFRSLAMKMKFRTSTSRVSEVNKKKIPIAIFTDSKRYWSPSLRPDQRRLQPLQVVQHLHQQFL